MLAWTGAAKGEGKAERQRGKQIGRDHPWFVGRGSQSKRAVGGNKGKLLSFHYARYQGPCEAFINN